MSIRVVFQNEVPRWSGLQFHRRKRIGVLAVCSALLGLLTVLVASSGCNMVATGQNMQGARLYEKGQYYPAMEKFQQAMASNPTDAERLLQSGVHACTNWGRPTKTRTC